MPISNQYDDEALRRVVVGVLELAAETITQSGRYTQAANEAAYSPDVYQGLAAASEAVQKIAQAFAQPGKTPEEILTHAREKLAMWAAKPADQFRADVESEVDRMVTATMKAQGMTDEQIKDLLEQRNTKDKEAPDGEDPEAVIRRVFKVSLNFPGNAEAKGLAFGRVSDNRPWGIFKAEGEGQTVYPVMVACAGDAHATSASTIFDTEADARNYVAAEFSPEFLLGEDGKVTKRTLN